LDKTVIIVAHRLSTVKYADQIVVLEKGEIVEVGSTADHEQIIALAKAAKGVQKSISQGHYMNSPLLPI
jgi:ABC-type multidrug transport system fused ATPase/permease subunit